MYKYKIYSTYRRGVIRPSLENVCILPDRQRTA